MCVFETYSDIMDMFDGDDFNEIIRQVDENQDGKISYEEFCTFMTEELTKEPFEL